MTVLCGRRGALAFATVFAFAGCSGTAANVAPNTAFVAAQHHGAQSMMKGLGNVALLYVTNADGRVSVYNYPTHKRVGVLTGFAMPKGECVDNDGNVYITDYQNAAIYEYAHGGSKPINAISEPYKPFDCAIDPKTGNLAVANYGVGGYEGSGNLAVYVHAKGRPSYYGNPTDHFTACGYDKDGDLLAAFQTDYSGPFESEFGYLATRSENFSQISVPGPKSGWSWGFIYATLWDGKYFDVRAVAPGSPAIYRYKIDTKAVYHDKIVLSDAGNLGPVALDGSGLHGKPTQIVGTSEEQSSKGYLTYWKYPAGGSPIYQTSNDLDNPYGAVVSPSIHLIGVGFQRPSND